MSMCVQCWNIKRNLVGILNMGWSNHFMFCYFCTAYNCFKIECGNNQNIYTNI